MATSKIKYTQIIEKLRFDAEYYQPEFLNTEEILKKSKALFLNKITEFSKLRGNPTRSPEKYFQYIDISNIDIFSGDIKLQILKGYDAPSRARKIVKANDVIISTVRPNRNAVAIIPKELDNQVCSTGFAVIKSKNINPWFLFAYLKTKYAVNQLVRVTMASMYPAVSENDIGAILIPNPPVSLQEKIARYVKEAYQKRQEADKKYKEAEKLLNKALGIEKLELKEEKIFEAGFDEIRSGQRLDVDFYNPVFRLSFKILKNAERTRVFSVKKLREVAKISKGIEVGSDAYVDDGKLFLRVSNITEKEIIIADSAEFIRENLFNELKTKYKPILGEVLYTKDATVGIAFPVSNNFDDAIISGGIVKIKPNKDLEPYYLALVLNSIVCRSQAKRYSIGVVIKHYAYSEIKDLLIPIVSKERQEQISSFIRQSFSLYEEAKALLEKAKREIEKIIEGEPR